MYEVIQDQITDKMPNGLIETGVRVGIETKIIIMTIQELGVETDMIVLALHPLPGVIRFLDRPSIGIKTEFFSRN